MTMSMFVPQIPTATTGYGFRTPFGIDLPPGSNVAAFLRSTGAQSGDDPAISPNLVTTLSSALLRVRSGLGDTIIALPGHSESVTDATMLTNMSAGTRILGCGIGANQPTFRWTATGSQWLLNKADVFIAGLRLRCEGANGVVLPFDVTAADVSISECDVEVSSGAANLATTILRVSAGATRFQFGPSNRVRGVAAGVCTDGFLINAAVDGAAIVGNIMTFPSTNGFFRTAAAATNTLIGGNKFHNTAAGVLLGGVFGAQAVEGLFYDNYISVVAAATPTSVITAGSGAMRFVQNFFSDAAGPAIFAANIGTAAAT